MSNFARYIHELFITWMIIVSVKGTPHEHKDVRRKKDEESSILTRHQVSARLNAPVLFPTQLRLWPQAENCCICNIKVHKGVKYRLTNICNISLDTPHAHEKYVSLPTGSGQLHN